jgi:Protein of unknown function (DUF2939)
MPAKKAIIGVFLAVAVAYVAYPYVTLYRLGQAIRSGDASSLETMVDWSSVREGIKEDICDLVIDEPAEAKAGGQLPPFGAGFVRGITGNAVDAKVTPQALAAVAAQEPIARPDPKGSPVRVSWAFFAGPTEFLVALRTPGRAEPINLQMEFRVGAWQVTRVWLPPELLAQANTRT